MTMKRINNQGEAVVTMVKTAQYIMTNQNNTNTTLVQHNAQSKGTAPLFHSSIFLGK